MIRTILAYWCLSVAVVSMVAGCSDAVPPTQSQPASDAQPAEPPTDRQLIRRAVFLDFIMQMSDGTEKKALFFLVLEAGEERDLDTIYTGYRVRPSSECIVDPVEQEVRAKSDGEQGPLLEVKTIEISGNSAEVYAGYFPGVVGYAFRLEKRDGAWVITEKALLFVE